MPDPGVEFVAQLGKSRADCRAPKGERTGLEWRRPVSEKRSNSRNPSAPRALSDRQPHTSDRHGRGQHEVHLRAQFDVVVDPPPRPIVQSLHEANV